MRKLLPVLLFTALLPASACQTMDAVMEKHQWRARSAQPDFEEWRHFYLFGLIPSEEKFLVSEMCPKGKLMRVRVKGGLWPGALAFLTAGIYVPKKVAAWCG